MANDKKEHSMVKAILTDIQFWIPTVILIVGILILLHVAVNR